jgi:hypothetical protein
MSSRTQPNSGTEWLSALQRAETRIQELTKTLELAEYVSRKDSLTEHERLENVRTVICHALQPKDSAK